MQTLQASFPVKRPSLRREGMQALAAWGAIVLVPVRVQLCSICAAMSPEISVVNDCRDPQHSVLWISAVVARVVGSLMVMAAKVLQMYFFPTWKVWLKRILLAWSLV